MWIMRFLFRERGWKKQIPGEENISCWVLACKGVIFTPTVRNRDGIWSRASVRNLALFQRWVKVRVISLSTASDEAQSGGVARTQTLPSELMKSAMITIKNLMKLCVRSRAHQCVRASRKCVFRTHFSLVSQIFCTRHCVSDVSENVIEFYSRSIKREATKSRRKQTEP